MTQKLRPLSRKTVDPKVSVISNKEKMSTRTEQLITPFTNYSTWLIYREF